MFQFHPDVDTAFQWVQLPLEAALASLLAFFLLFAGFSLLKRRPTIGSLLFVLAAVTVLLSSSLQQMAVLPDSIGRLFGQLERVLQDVIVLAGMRGLLIGIALGTLTFGIRILAGMERPYNK